MNELIERIEKEILGTPQHGFEPEKWQKFAEENFSREGEISGEKYSSTTNYVLSSAAMSQTLSQIRLLLQQLKEEG